MNTDDLAAIENPRERMRAAATLARRADAKVKELRTKRDLAVLVMLRPFADAVAATNAHRARLREQRDRGEITHDQYTELLAENREQRQRDIREANVTVQPVDVYEALDVARNVVNRILMRMPVEPLPEVKNPKAAAKRAQAAIPQWEETLRRAREIRTEAAVTLLSGGGGEFMSNAEVARETGLSTARIAQLRSEAALR